MAVTESVVELLLQKLGDPLTQEAIFLHGVHDQVEWLKAEFMRIRCFLGDADAKQEGDGRVKNWAQDVKDVAYDAEDLFDTFVFDIVNWRRRVFVGGCIRRYPFISNELIVRRKVGFKIERIKNKMREISENRSVYGIENIGQEAGGRSAGLSRQDRSRVSPYDQEPDFVGFENDLESLVAWLTEGEMRRCVISIVGMGGLGKTTLAKKVYNNGIVKKHFDTSAWITVSQEYGVRDLLQDVIKLHMKLSKEVLEKVEKMDVFQLRNEISEYLKKKRYLIILDDIWTLEAWDALKDAFPDMKNGSRVMVTTRKKDVAIYADPESPPHELRLLTNEESWGLFCRKAFPGQDGNCPQYLEMLGRRIVDNCHGLPLTIVAMGRLLSGKEPQEWENVQRSIRWQFVSGEFAVSGILSLSYRDLPHRYKPCFLYLAIFPEDYEFRAKKLIQLWAAEGLLHHQRGDQTVEEVGEDCLKELFHRNMIHHTKRSSSGGINNFRIFHLVHDLSKSLAEKGDFLRISAENLRRVTRSRRLAVHFHSNLAAYPEISSIPHLRSSLCHRLAVHFHSNRAAYPEISSIPHLRSLLCFQMENQLLPFRRFKLLRVLDLERASITEWPNGIEKLMHLRYLGLRGTGLKRIPRSARNLQNLLTLDVKFTSIKELPDAIREMKWLRHLHANRYIVNSQILESLINIQTLPMMQADAWMNEGLGKLTNLRKLGISGDLSFCNKALSSLVNLRSLRVEFGLGNTILDLTSLSGHLVKLHLEMRLEKLPQADQLSQNLVKLSLRWSLLEQDPFPTLERLRNLKTVILGRGSFVGKKMVCSREGFPKLDFLKLDFLNDLEEWRVEEGALPRLNHLVLQSCRRLKMLPEGLQHLTTLGKLEVSFMPDEFEARLQEDEGEDWYKIRHIPQLDIK